MSLLKDLKNELKEKDKLDHLTKGNCIALKQAWLRDQEQECKRCPATDRLTLDHIVPKELLDQFIDEAKIFNPKWYQILCYRCNSFKGNKLDLADPRTKQILLDLIVPLR